MVSTSKLGNCSALVTATLGVGFITAVCGKCCSVWVDCFRQLSWDIYWLIYSLVMFMHTSCLCFSLFTASVVVVYVCFYYSHCLHIHNKNNCFAGSLATQPLTRTSILRWRHRCWKHLPRQNGRYNLWGVFSLYICVCARTRVCVCVCGCCSPNDSTNRICCLLWKYQSVYMQNFCT